MVVNLVVISRSRSPPPVSGLRMLLDVRRVLGLCASRLLILGLGAARSQISVEYTHTLEIGVYVRYDEYTYVW